LVLPGGNTAFKHILLDMARSTAQLTLKERLFNDQIPGMVFFVNRMSPDGKRLYQILISDERDPANKTTITAEEGLLFSDPEKEGFSLELRKGTILRVDDELNGSQIIYFQKYVLHVDLASAIGKKEFRKKERHLTFTELRRALDSVPPNSPEQNKLLLEWHRRFSLPFACIILAFVAVPLGVQAGSTSRLTGVILGLFLFLLYYALVSVAKALGENGLFPPFLGLWLPNLLFIIIAVFLWVTSVRGSHFQLVAKVKDTAESLISRLGYR